jgi:hypothetical protein
MHYPHSCNNTHYKHKTKIHCEENLNASKLKGHLTFFHFFHLGQPVVFAINTNFFSSTPFNS